MYKICESCGTHNENSTIFCKECLSINFIMNELQVEEICSTNNQTIIEPKNTILKIKKENEFCVEIKNNDTIGRESILKEYLKDNLKISRIHSRFLLENNSWFIIDENSTNGTFLNNIKLNVNEKKLLTNNDKIKLSLSYSLDVIIE